MKNEELYREIIKLKLKEAIIINDVSRIRNKEEPINNINQLALILQEYYPEDYEYDRLRLVLYRAYKQGHHKTYSDKNMGELITRICEVLNTTREQLVEEEEI